MQLRSYLPFSLLAAAVLTACGSSGSRSSATADPGTSTVTVPQTAGIPSDGIAGASIEVLLRNSSGTVLPMRPVTVTVDGAGHAVWPAPTTATGLDGRTEFRLTSTQSGRKRVRVTAELDDGTATLADGIDIDFGTPTVARARVSVSSGGAEANDFNGHAAVSGNGRFVGFLSKAFNLVPGDTNQKEDVFVHDRQTRTTERVSLTPAGGQFPDLSGKPSLSDDGSLVAFMGRLDDDDDIWVRDRVSGTTQPISQATPLSGRFFDPMLSGDGRWVAFVNNNGESQQVYVYDRVLLSLELVSQSSAGQPGNEPSFAPSISRNGRWVAFASNASNLVPNDSNEKIDVYLRDRQTGTTTRVSLSAGGNEGDDDSIEAAIAADGRWVAFSSKAANLVPDDDNGKSDVFVVDTQTGAIQRASVNPQGGEVDKESWQPKLNADGSYVVFSSLSDDLVAGDSNGKEDVFRRDLVAGVTIRVSLGIGSTNPNEFSTGPALASDAPVVAYTSKASNLVPSDSNDKEDVFVAPRD
ncbi:MAG: PD40 domain-containing protein [Planctomycetes bacterium]|nr:PD40 domain-containing protein [Planctomycetota bacterium]